MQNVKDEIEFFIKECGSIKYYRKKIEECNEKLEEIATKLEGLSSPAIKEIIYENARDPYKEKKLYLLEEERLLIQEKEHWMKSIKYIRSIFKCMPDKKDKRIIIEMYINKSNRDALATKYFYANHTSLRRYANKKIEEAIKMYHGSLKKDVK